MEGVEQCARSKVIVQCTDPSSLLEEFSFPLQSHLPLGNLHWKSPTRPLRSIDALDISLQRDESIPGDSAISSRRHQIPGLDQTPYVKLYLLRCDDKETYRDTIRKELKQWAKTQDLKSTSKGKERHDAFEYMIVHVVLPNTPADAQPRSSKHISVEANESTESLNSKSKWTGKNPSTIYDKLRADFSSSSKSSFDRVAQVRLSDSSKPNSVLTPTEINDQWQNLIEKLKTAILRSFDARVTQYEEDIRERESQRNLPGWNFCTYFILKEGLARGFENTGLLEDALVIYDELEAGLDAVIQEQAQAREDNSAGALLPFSNDLKSMIRKAFEPPTVRDDARSDSAQPVVFQDWAELESQQFALDLERRDYQTMILTNEVSVLDFRIYVFIRVKQLLLRHARSSGNSRRGNKKSLRQSEILHDYNILADLCQRSMSFINLASRSLRQDLYAAWGGQDGLNGDELQIQARIIGNIVGSWKWSAILQILMECRVFEYISPRSTYKDMSSPGLRTNSTTPLQWNNDVLSAIDVESRPSSSQSRQSDPSSSSRLNGSLSTRKVPVTANGEMIPERWLFWVAELFSTASDVLDMMSKLIPPQSQSENDEKAAPNGFNASDTSFMKSEATAGMFSLSLKQIASSFNFLEAVKLLLSSALQCYHNAGRGRAFRQILLKLANLELVSGDAKMAADRLENTVDLDGSSSHTLIDQALLDLYRTSLKELDRPLNYARSLICCLQKTGSDLQRESHTQELFDELVAVSHTLETLEVPFSGLLSVEKMDSSIAFADEGDGCRLTLYLKFLVPVSHESISGMVLTLRALNGATPESIELVTDPGLQLTNSSSKVTFQGKVTTEGWYRYDQLNVTIGNIHFRQIFQPSFNLPKDQKLKQKRLDQLPSIYVYPSSAAPRIRAKQASVIDLEERRAIHFGLFSGDNAIRDSQLRIKPSTAGFRLDLAATKRSRKEDMPDLEIMHAEDAMVLKLQHLDSKTFYSVEIPYTLENPGSLTLAIRCELTYETVHGRHTVYQVLSISPILAVSVNVQDIFQSSKVFSRFTIWPTTLVPVTVAQCRIAGGDKHRSEAGHRFDKPVDVFPKMPASWIVELEPDQHQQMNKPRTRLQLIIDYCCLDELMLQAAEEAFLEDIKEIQVHFAVRMLCSKFLASLQTSWNEQDLELAALTRIVPNCKFDDVVWHSALSALDKSTRTQVREWLKNWHHTRNVFEIKPSNSCLRQLKLWFELPQPQIVISTRLVPHRSHHSSYITLGTAITAELVITYSGNLTPDVEISFEVMSQADTWLLGGNKKGVISYETPSTSKFIVIMIPQRTGHLLLPGIEVRCQYTKSAINNPAGEIKYEVDHQSQARSVQVISDIRTTTIGVSDVEIGTSNWLLATSSSKRQS